jgi:hypothetical protein
MGGSAGAGNDTGTGQAQAAFYLAGFNALECFGGLVSTHSLF